MSTSPNLSAFDISSDTTPDNIESTLSTVQRDRHDSRSISDSETVVGDEDSGYEADIETYHQYTPTQNNDERTEEMRLLNPISLSKTPANYVMFLTDCSYRGSPPVEGTNTPDEFSDCPRIYGVGVDPNALSDALNNLKTFECYGRPEHRTGNSRCRASAECSLPKRKRGDQTP